MQEKLQSTLGLLFRYQKQPLQKFLALSCSCFPKCRDAARILMCFVHSHQLTHQGASLIAHLQHRRPQFDSWDGKICWRRDRLLTPVFLGFPGGSAGKESACNAGDLGSIIGLGRSPGEGKGYPLQYSGLENHKEDHKESDTAEQLSLSPTDTDTWV